MPSWANQLMQQYDDDMIDGGVHQLTVNGQTTCIGGLDVGAGNNQLEITSDANGARIERLGAGTTLSLNADLPLEGGDVIISHRDGATQPTVIIRSQRLRIGSPEEPEGPAEPGHIDANGQNVPLLGQTLNIGTQGVHPQRGHRSAR